MTRDHHRQLARYVLGQSTEDEKREVEAACLQNENIAAQLGVLRELSGCEESVPDAASVPPQQSRAVRRPKWGTRPLLTLAIVLVTGFGISWAGWKVFSPKPLLADNFNSNWGDSKRWITPRRIVTVEGGHVRLFDRGYLVTREEFAGPIDLRFRWRWTDLSGDFHYRDELSVILRTSGQPRAAYPHEVSDGLKINFNATAGFVGAVWIDGTNREAEPQRASLPLPAETWFNVRITDDGNRISVFIAPETAGDQAMEHPIVTFQVPDSSTNHRIAFYNRERLADASHESWLDDVEIRRLTVEPGRNP